MNNDNKTTTQKVVVFLCDFQTFNSLITSPDLTGFGNPSGLIQQNNPTSILHYQKNYSFERD